MRLCKIGLSELHQSLAKREISSVDLLESFLGRIKEVEPQVRSYLSLMEKRAREQAIQADKRIRNNENVTFLTGIPIAVKDNICVSNHSTTCASKILENFCPPYDATVVERLEAAGAVFTGKTNMDEFAMGSSTENSAFGATHNPWKLDCVPGGSSGGSAAAVAACEAVAALGSDTGGSIRQPASLCGVAGLKPTYGLVSRYGLVAFASSLDQIGPIARNVPDCAKLFECIGGHDPRDSTSAKVEIKELPDYNLMENLSEKNVKGMVVGVINELLGKGLDPQVKEATLKTARKLEELGAKIEEVSLKSIDYAMSVYYLIASAEASSNLARYDGTRYGLRIPSSTAKGMFSATRETGFGSEVKRRIMLGTYALSAGYYDELYLKAQKARTLMKQEFDRAFQKCRILLSPTSPTPAFKLGEKLADPLTMYLSDVCTIPANLAGIPALSIPAGFSSEELPIGVQLLSPPFYDFTLLYTGAILEHNLALEIQLPPLTA